MDRCSQISGADDQNDLELTSTGGMATFRNPVAPTWRLRLGSCQALNVEVVARDLFTTRNLLKSHAERNLLSPYSNIRAVTSKLCARSSLAIVQATGFEIFAVARHGSGSFNPGSVRSRSRPRSRPCSATRPHRTLKIQDSLSSQTK